MFFHILAFFHIFYYNQGYVHTTCTINVSQTKFIHVSFICSRFASCVVKHIIWCGTRVYHEQCVAHCILHMDRHHTIGAQLLVDVPSVSGRSDPHTWFSFCDVRRACCHNGAEECGGKRVGMQVHMRYGRAGLQW